MALPNEFDPELPVIEAIRTGDRHAFGELVGRHDRWVRSVIYGVLGDADRVDDVAQQAWTALWERIGELRDGRRWRAWLYRLARNAAIDAGRDATRRKRRQDGVTSREVARASDGQTPDANLVSAEEISAVRRAVQALPALYREPFVLKHVNGWSYREIAELMDMPVQSVETRLVRARRLLRESLSERTVEHR